jgi:hypothetical protein
MRWQTLWCTLPKAKTAAPAACIGVASAMSTMRALRAAQASEQPSLALAARTTSPAGSHDTLTHAPRFAVSCAAHGPSCLPRNAATCCAPRLTLQRRRMLSLCMCKHAREARFAAALQSVPAQVAHRRGSRRRASWRRLRAAIRRRCERCAHFASAQRGMGYAASTRAPLRQPAQQVRLKKELRQPARRGACKRGSACT